MKIILVQDRHKWDYHDPLLHSLLAMLDTNPFGVFQTVEFDFNNQRLPYDRQFVWQHYANRLRMDINLYATIPFALEGILHLEKEYTVLQLIADDPYLPTVPLEGIVSYVQQLSRQLPSFYFSRITCKSGRGIYYTHHLIELPPTMGDYFVWRNEFSPRAYLPHWSKMEMLGIPTYQVRELADEWIEVLNYPHPLDFDTPAAIEHVVAASRYLTTVERERHIREHQHPSRENRPLVSLPRSQSSGLNWCMPGRAVRHVRRSKSRLPWVAVGYAHSGAHLRGCPASAWESQYFVQLAGD